MAKSTSKVVSKNSDKNSGNSPLSDPQDVSTLAIVALVLGIIGVVLFWIPVVGLLIAIAGFVTGLMSLSRIGKSKQKGKGMSIAGIVTGALGMFIGVIYLIGLLIVAGIFTSIMANDCISSGGDCVVYSDGLGLYVFFMPQSDAVFDASLITAQSCNVTEICEDIPGCDSRRATIMNGSIASIGLECDSNTDVMVSGKYSGLDGKEKMLSINFTTED